MSDRLSASSEPTKPGRLRGRLLWLLRLPLYLLAGAVGLAAVTIGIGNAILGTDRGIPYRALDAASADCVEDAANGWDILSRSDGARTRTGGVGNDEWAAIDLEGGSAQRKLGCAIQRHAIPGYRKDKDQPPRRLGYDLAFLEFQENGKPYALRKDCPKDNEERAKELGCYHDSRFGYVYRTGSTQLRGLLDHLKRDSENKRPHYVMVFVHGWRHNADIGDSNVGDFRHYAAHAARFIEDRFPGSIEEKPRVTAVYVGWPGARTDETWLRRSFSRIGARIDAALDPFWQRSPVNRIWFSEHLGDVGQTIGLVSALPTLFDRKPVSEAVASGVVTSLRAIERQLGVDAEASPSGAPVPKQNKMIVFGHSLGGNLLATALEDSFVKKVERHEAGTYMLPALGDLVILINPAAEAEKWISIQRAVWKRIAMSRSERESTGKYVAGHNFFPATQRPIFISVTAARDWPMGGRSEVECFRSVSSSTGGLADTLQEQSRHLALKGTNYDWATYELFPAFKGDFRPLGDLVQRWGSGRDPHNQCMTTTPWTPRRFLLNLVAQTMRTLPFNQTDPHRTHTIGHLDPPSMPQLSENILVFPENPFGTTHEVFGLSPTLGANRKRPPLEEAKLEHQKDEKREVPVSYNEILDDVAACPTAPNWLQNARTGQKAARLFPNGTNWSSKTDSRGGPALTFLHGFGSPKLAPITRANDPFWNMRAFDTALARHDGYLLSSFICAMNQLVLDDITDVSAAPPAAPGLAPERASQPVPDAR